MGVIDVALCCDGSDGCGRVRFTFRFPVDLVNLISPFVCMIIDDLINENL